MRVVAEGGQCHGGSVQTAIDMCWHARHAGATAIKFQHLTPETIARADAPKYWTDDFGTTNQRDAFRRAGLIDEHGWQEVAAAAADFGIEFVSTPFDLEAVDELERLGVQRYKIASGDITYQQLVQRVAQTRKPVSLSTGAATLPEIWRAFGWLADCPEVTLLACTLSYPTAAQDAHLGRIETLRKRCGDPVGYSDHTSMCSTALAAAALGATALEVHYTLDRAGPDVPDHAMAVNPSQLQAYVTAAELGEKLRGSVDVEPCEAEQAARIGARRSVCAARDLAEGHLLSVEDFVFLRPGDGWPPFHVKELVGKRLDHPVAAGEAI